MEEEIVIKLSPREIEKCLKEMGGKPAVCSLDDYETVGSGRAKPEYIVTFNKDKNTKEYIAKMFAGLIVQGIDLGLNNNLKQH